MHFMKSTHEKQIETAERKKNAPLTWNKIKCYADDRKHARCG